MKKLIIPVLIAILATATACGYKANLVLPDQVTLEKSKPMKTSVESSDETDGQKRKKNGTSSQ